MEKYWTKKKVLFIVMVVLIAAIIPFIINWAYKKGGYVTVWDGSDLLAFYGNILTAAAAVLGVYYTLDYSKFKQMDFEKLRVKPYFGVDTIFYLHDDFEVFSATQDKKYIFKDIDVKHCESSEIDLPITVYNIKNNGTCAEKKAFVDRCIVTIITLRNVGADSAIKIKLWINEGGYSRVFSMSKDEEQVLKLVTFLGNKPDIIDKQDEKARYTKKTIALKLYYENIYGNQTYMQSGDIEVKLDELSGAFHITTAGTFFINQTEINN